MSSNKLLVLKLSNDSVGCGNYDRWSEWAHLALRGSSAMSVIAQRPQVAFQS